jgi:hypothetical protein
MSYKKIEHAKISQHSRKIHEIFSCLAPSTTRETESQVGGRIRFFSKIATSDPVDTHDDKTRTVIKDETGISSRSGMKSCIEGLEHWGLIERKNSILYLSDEGEKTWNGLIAFVKAYAGETPSPVSPLSSYYEFVDVRVSTDGREKTTWLWNWCLKNKGEPIHELYRLAESGAPIPPNQFKLKQYSNNIKGYKIVSDEPLNKSFNLLFKRLVKTDETVAFWYSYDWPQTYLLTYEEWNMRFVFTDYPAKFFSATFYLPERSRALPDSIRISKTDGLPSKTQSIGEFQVFEPALYNEDKRQSIVWNLINFPTYVQFLLAWRHKE